MDDFFNGTVTPTMGAPAAAVPFNPPPAKVLPGNPATLGEPFVLLPNAPPPWELLEPKMLPEFVPPELPPALMLPGPLFREVPDDDPPPPMPPELSLLTLSPVDAS